jgi:hypothetical protein
MAHQAGPLDKRFVFTPNRGPLTTIFTPPSNCLATTTALDTSYFVGSQPDGDLGGFPSCYPSSTLSVAVSDDVFQPAVYSPGVCPFGYTYAFPCKCLPDRDSAFFNIRCFLRYIPNRRNRRGIWIYHVHRTSHQIRLLSIVGLTLGKCSLFSTNQP